MTISPDYFISLLKDFPQLPNVFNPWCDIDSDNDIGPESPVIRREQLKAYLSERIGKARYVLMGEALGYQGGHFTGIAMTSERIILGCQKDKGLCPEYIFSSISPRRTSRPEIKVHGFTEPTATIVWRALLKEGIDPREFVIWNSFAWHPYNPSKGFLSNRRPLEEELNEGETVLRQFLLLFPDSIVIAVGNIAGERLKALGIDFIKVRHPANGGAGKFRQQLGAALDKR
ncbi:MAG: uracil-DNA glycosylase [bacterium]|nr:uracil-DNA glycosylase [bacterium]